MTVKHDNATTGANLLAHSTHPLAHYSRRLIILALTLFGVSVLFPIVASLTRTELLPVWVGWLDVTLASVVGMLMLLLDRIARGRVDHQDRQASYRIYRILANGLLLLLIVFFVVGDQVQWEVLLPGLAWRMWVLIYTVPAGLAIWRITPAQEDKR